MAKLVIPVLLIILSAGCGGGTAQVSGSWHAQVTSSIFGNGPLDLFITQSGTTLSSPTVMIGFGNCAGIARMAGTINGNDVTLNVRWMADFSYVLTFTGTVSNSVMTGSYTTSGAPQCSNGDKGTFSATLLPSVASASWTGTTTSSIVGTMLKFAANLSENNLGNLSGSLTFAGSSCVSIVNVAGTQIGAQLNLTSDTLGLHGTISSDGKSVTGVYSLGAACSFDSGTFSMSRP